MAKLTIPSLILPSLVLFVLLNSGGNLKFANGDEIVDNNEVNTWCVAKPSSDELALSNNLQYACDNEMVDCGILEEGKECFYPDTLINHASIAMNLYYQANGRNYWNCDFMKSGVISISDPSYGDCKY